MTNISKAIITNLNESTRAELKNKRKLKVKTKINEACKPQKNSIKKLKEVEEWDNETKKIYRDEMETNAKDLVSKTDCELIDVDTFNNRQGPCAKIKSPKYGTLELWFDITDDLLKNFILYLPKVDSIEGSIEELADKLNSDKIEEFELKNIQEETNINIHDYPKERDYVISDVTVLEPVADGDIQSPNIQALLLDLEEALSNRYGENWGTINIQTTKKNSESSFALIETELAKDTFLMNFIVNGKKALKEFVITNTNGTTIYKKKTLNPVRAMYEWLDSELLIGENAPLKKLQEAEKAAEYKVEEGGISIENIEEFINSKMNPEIFEAKAAIDCLIKGLKDVPNENKEYVKNFIKDKINSLIVELPRKMKKGKDEKNQELMFPTNEEIITKVFGKEWIKQDKLTEAEILRAEAFNDPHNRYNGKYYGELDDGTYFIVGNDEGVILDDENPNIYELTDEAANEFYREHTIKKLSNKETEDLYNKVKNFKPLNKTKNIPKYDKSKGNKILIVKDIFEPEGISSIRKYAIGIEKINEYMANYKIKITYNEFIKWLMIECDYTKEEAIEEANNYLEYNLDESKKIVTEAYDNITIGDISLVYNPQTYEALYSIDSADVHDKKINLSKVPTVQTPYDTETIIKDFVEKKYGPIPQEESKESVPQEEPTAIEEPVPQEEPVDTETIDVQMQDDTVTEADEELDNNDTDALANIDIDNTEETTADETPEDIENIEDEPAEEKETGSANFFRMPKSVEDMRVALQDGVSQGKSTYLVTQTKELSPEEFNKFSDNLKAPQAWLEGVRPEDLKNYAFNVVKVTSPNENYSILVDPSATNFAKFAAILDENI